MNTIEAQAPAQTRASRALAFVGRFHLWMAFAISTLLMISLAGCALTGIELPAWRVGDLLPGHNCDVATDTGLLV